MTETGSPQLDEFRYQMEFAHRNLRVFLMFHPEPYRWHPIHSDVEMCRINMAYIHNPEVSNLVAYATYGA